MKDLRAKMEKDVGVWITVEEDDNINNIDFPIGWSAGNTTISGLVSLVQKKFIYWGLTYHHMMKI